VRDDIRDDDAEQLSDTLNLDLVRPFIDLNFGPQEEYPTISIGESDSEDIAALVAAVEKLVPLGLKVEQSVMCDKLGLPDAKGAKPEDLLQVAQPVYPGMAFNRQQTTHACNSRAPQENSSRIVDAMASQTTPAMDSWINTIKRALEQATSLDDFKQRLVALGDELDPAELGELIGLGMTLARAGGMAEVINEN
jgi:phage gp29-like protein